MAEVYGILDDEVVIEGAQTPYDLLYCYNTDLQIWFTDGTIIKVSYGKEKVSIWNVEIVKEGTAPHVLTECMDEKDRRNSDFFSIDADYLKHKFGNEGEQKADLRVIFLKFRKEYPLEDVVDVFREVFGK